MAVTIVTSGTQNTNVGSSPDVLATQAGATGGAWYCLMLDTNALAGGDILVMTVLTKVLSGGTTRKAYEATVTNVQADPIKTSPNIPVDDASEVVVQINQTAGSTRAVPWKLLQTG